MTYLLFYLLLSILFRFIALLNAFNDWQTLSIVTNQLTFIFIRCLIKSN